MPSQAFDYNAPLLAMLAAILSYTMAGWQHGSKHAEVWWQCPLSKWEQNQNKWPLFALTLLFVTEIARSALSLRIGVPVELRLCPIICSTERKNGLQQHHVKMCKYVICMEYGRIGSIPYIKSSIPYLGHFIFHTDIFLPFHIPFHTIPYHSMP